MEIGTKKKQIQGRLVLTGTGAVAVSPTTMLQGHIVFLHSHAGVWIIVGSYVTKLIRQPGSFVAIIRCGKSIGDA